MADPVDTGADTVPWARLHAETVERLAAAGIANADAEARWIVERAAGDPFRVVADRPATVRTHHHWRLMVERRERGEPLQYVLERWAFRRLELFVDRRVLIPRPETEVLVEIVLEEHTRVGGPVVDLGTGSGAIALSVVVERPDHGRHLRPAVVACGDQQQLATRPDEGVDPGAVDVVLGGDVHGASCRGRKLDGTPGRRGASP